jgi:hypothetical protein
MWYYFYSRAIRVVTPLVDSSDIFCPSSVIGSKIITYRRHLYQDLLPEQKKRFGFLAYQYRKNGIRLQISKREPTVNCGVKRYLLNEISFLRI